MNHGRIHGLQLPVPRLILGTLGLAALGFQAASALLDAAYAEGWTAFDTAPVYGGGAAEEILGRWIELRGVRDSVIVIDKGCHPQAGIARLNPADLKLDLLRSLERLRTRTIDLYLLHRDDPTRSVAEIVCALNEQLHAGRIRAFGASNWTHDRIQLANQYAMNHGLVPFAAASPGLSLAQPLRSWPGCVSIQPSLHRDSMRFYAETRLPLLAWSPLGRGFLTGRFRPEDAAVSALPSDRQVLEFYASEENFERLERLKRLARGKGLSVAQAALAYVLSQPLEIFAILGCQSADQIDAAEGALSIRLTSQELSDLELDLMP